MTNSPSYLPHCAAPAGPSATPNELESWSNYARRICRITFDIIVLITDSCADGAVTLARLRDGLASGGPGTTNSRLPSNLLPTRVIPSDVARKVKEGFSDIYGGLTDGVFNVDMYISDIPFELTLPKDEQLLMSLCLKIETSYLLVYLGQPELELSEIIDISALVQAKAHQQSELGHPTQGQHRAPPEEHLGIRGETLTQVASLLSDHLLSNGYQKDFGMSILTAHLITTLYGKEHDSARSDGPRGRYEDYQSEHNRSCDFPAPLIESTTCSRLGIRDGVMENMKGAARIAIVALSIAAQTTQNVPYLGAISFALTEFIKIQDEVNQCKDECRAAIADAQTLKAIIDNFRDKCFRSGKEHGVLDESLQAAFTELEGIVLECIIYLQKCTIDYKRKRDRIFLYFKRSALAKSVRDCSAKMDKALQRFNTILQVDQVVILEDLRLAVDRLREEQPQDVMQAASSGLPTEWSLRAAPPIFYGRESEVAHVLDLIEHQAPSRVAIVGSGGIGKTSIALTVLHHPHVKALYDGRRCFVPCEALTTADGVVRALAAAIHLQFESSVTPEHAQHRLLSDLKSVRGIVCLDNFETPWDADTAAVEILLSEIASTPSLALLITSRVTDTPLIGWSFPPLKPIAPFSFDAAVRTWDTICTGYDEYAVRIVQAVDCMPLAVTLLARLARSETTKSIWERWERERIDMIQFRGIRHRLNNVGVSIEISLRALEYREAVDVLTILCMYADGVGGNLFPRLDDAFKGRLSFRHAIKHLTQSSLVYTYGGHPRLLDPEYQHFNVLSPIRHHMLKHHPISDELFMILIDYMLHLKGIGDWDQVFKLGLDRQGTCRERCLQVLRSSSYLTRNLEVVSEAIRESEAYAREPFILAELYRRYAFVALYYVRTGYARALPFLSRAIELDERLNDDEQLFFDWCDWIIIFLNHFAEYEDEKKHLEEVQSRIRKTWALGLDERQRWRRGWRGFLRLAEAQHDLNKRRRNLDMPIDHRSCLYLGNDSTCALVYEPPLYTELTAKGLYPPWDFSLILDELKGWDTVDSRAAKKIYGW
ncbi:unnamed protein product [Peniophora sp. CBMAI 1063]|nr:unnamed protein product [Peniophora sp. CBMAI 1063]